jgi:hypothetical protein
MKGRPGALTITTSGGLSATTRRVVADQATSELGALKHAGMRVTLDAGARQLVRMTLARPLEDDPVLLGRQQELAALKVVGSGVDASQTGCGKTITSGRTRDPRRHNPAAASDDRRRGAAAGTVARRADAGHARPRAAAAGDNVEVRLVDERRSVAGQIRSFDGAVGDRPGVALIRNGTLDRYSTAGGDRP